MIRTEQTFVTRIDDDSDKPIVGLVVTRDAPRGGVWVAWGDAAHSENPRDDARFEYADELVPSRAR